MTDAACRADVERSFYERNRLARQCADLRDSLDTLKAEASSAQQRHVEQLALHRLPDMTVEEVAERLYQDEGRVWQILKEQLFHEGYIEGLAAARAATTALHLNAEREGWPVAFGG